MVVQVEFYRLVCSCGFAFFVPLDFLEARQDHGEDIFCPSCEKAGFYRVPEKPAEKKVAEEREEIKSLRRQIAQLVHEREQAEAKASEASGRRPTDDQLLAQQEPEPEPDHAAEIREAVLHAISQGERIKCHLCEKEYQQSVRYATHMRKVHRLDPLSLKPLDGSRT